MSDTPRLLSLPDAPTLTAAQFLSDLFRLLDRSDWDPLTRLQWLRGFRTLMEGRFPPGFCDGRDSLFDHLDTLVRWETHRMGYCWLCGYPLIPGEAQCPTCSTRMDGDGAPAP